MNKAVKNNFHWFLLGAIPFLFLYAIINISKAIDIQWHDTYFVIGFMQVAAGLSFGLIIKALLYYWTRTYPYLKILCYLDVFLTVLICFLVFYNNYLPLGETSIERMQSFQSIRLYKTLLIVFWVLIQLFVFINFFVHLLIRTGRGDKGD